MIINIRARANHHDPGRARALASVVGRSDHVATTRSLDELEVACTDLARERPAIVAICGGDGTLHQTLTALIRSYGHEPLPAIAILRGGAMNIVATSLGIEGDPVRDLRALVELKRRGAPAGAPGGAPGGAIETFKHSLLQIGDRYGFFVGTGVICAFLEAYYATGRPSAVTAARLLVRAAGSTMVGGALASRLFRSFHARVVADDSVWPRDRFIALCASSVEQLGLGFRPFYRCREHGDGFAVLGLDTTLLGLLRALPRVRAGKPIRRADVIDGVARALAITPLDPARLGYTIDGDLYTTDRTLEIRRGPTLEVVRLTHDRR